MGIWETILSGHYWKLHALISKKPELVESRLTNLSFAKIASALINNPNITANHLNLITPLHLCAALVNVPAMACLIENRADINARNIYFETPLSFAIATNQAEAVKFLLQHQANPNLIDSSGATPLTITTSYGYKDIVAMLLNAKADIHYTPNGWTALHITVFQKNHLLMALLLSHSTNLDYNPFQIYTPLQLAVQRRDIKSVELLLSHKANPHTLGCHNQSALSLAKRTNSQIFDLLCNHETTVHNQSLQPNRSPIQLQQLTSSRPIQLSFPSICPISCVSFYNHTLQPIKTQSNLLSRPTNLNLVQHPSPFFGNTQEEKSSVQEDIIVVCININAILPVLFSRLKSKNLSDLQRSESNYNAQKTTQEKFIKEFFESTQNSSLKNESELLILLNKVLNNPKLRIAITSDTDCADTIKLICDYMLIRLQKNGYQLPPTNTLKEKVFWSKQTCHMPYYLDHENIPLVQIGHLKKLLYRNPEYLQIAYVSKFASPPLNSGKLVHHAYAYHHFNQNTTRVVGFVLIGENQQDTALTLKHFWKIIPTQIKVTPVEMSSDEYTAAVCVDKLTTAVEEALKHRPPPPLTLAMCQLRQKAILYGPTERESKQLNHPALNQMTFRL